MSARDKILRFAEENHNNLVDPWCDPETGYFIDDWQTHLGGLLDAFAHELAEQQRAWVADRTDMPWWADEIADVIDPKKSAAPLRPDEEPTT